MGENIHDSAEGSREAQTVENSAMLGDREAQASDSGEAQTAEDSVLEAKRTFSRLGWCYVVGTLVMNGAQIVLFPLVSLYHPEWMSSTNIMLVLSSIITYGLTMPLIYLLARSMPTKKPEKRRIKVGQFLVLFLMCYALIFVSNIVGNVVTAVAGLMKGSQVDNKLIGYVTSSKASIMLVIMVFLAPVIEELIFRKVLVDRTLKYGAGMSVVLSGLMFGLFHGNMNQFAYAVVLGAFFAYIYIRTGDIRITMGLHMMVNFLGSIVASALLKAIHYDELLTAATENPEMLLEIVGRNAVGWVLYGLYAVLILSVVIAGIVLLVLNRKKFVLQPGEVQVPGDQRLQTLILNPGMLFFCLLWIGTILYQMFA